MKKNQIKKLIVALAVVMAFTFTACSSTESTTENVEETAEDTSDTSNTGSDTGDNGDNGDNGGDTDSGNEALEAGTGPGPEVSSDDAE